jgi:hypothetical protein
VLCPLSYEGVRSNYIVNLIDQRENGMWISHPVCYDLSGNYGVTTGLKIKA